ncbi:MAG: ubiquitin-like domain-containing protein [Nitriliruptoraceae bacterium]
MDAQATRRGVPTADEEVVTVPRARRHHAVLATVGVLALLTAGAAVLFAASSHVEVVVDDEVLATRTLGGDVGAVLDRLEVAVADADRVEPPPDTPVRDGLVIVVDRARSVEVHVDDREPQTVTAVATTVEAVLRAAGLEHLLEREARIQPPRGSPVADGDRIEITLPTAVRILADGREHRVETYAGTVAGAIVDAGVAVHEQDRVDPPRDQQLSSGTTISVQRVEVREEVVEEPIDHGEQRRETEELLVGETRVANEGHDGLRREVHRVTLVDGEEADRELTREEVVREPTDRVVLVGTGKEPEPEPAPATGISPVREAQQLLADLGYPVGPVDGIEGPQTRRALCAWRRLEGREVSRRSLQDGELTTLRASDGLPAANSSGRGVTVDNTCQVLYLRQDGRWQHVHPVSTGTDGLPRAGSYTISWKRPGWHTSSLYPASQPNMYNSMYFHGAIAIHGSRHVPPRPASAGCVRVTPTAADQLFEILQVGDPVRVIGAW